MSFNQLQLTPRLNTYLNSISAPESESARALRLATDSLPKGKNRSSRAVINLLTFIIQLTQAKRILEVGTFTGYATLHFAKCLPKNGEVVTCDIDEATTALGKTYWQRAGVINKIKSHIAPAEQSLQMLLHQGGEGQFDFAYIDANKSQYVTYYELCLSLVKPGGVIAIDNVLFGGRVINRAVQNNMTKAIRKLNALIASDHRVQHCVLPITDGVSIVFKK